MSNIINAEWDIRSNGKKHWLEIMSNIINAKWDKCQIQCVSAYSLYILVVKLWLQMQSHFKKKFRNVRRIFHSPFFINQCFVHVGFLQSMLFSINVFLPFYLLSQLTFFKFYVFSYRRLLFDILSQWMFFYLLWFVPVGIFSIRRFVPFGGFSFDICLLTFFNLRGFLLRRFVCESSILTKQYFPRGQKEERKEL